MFDPKSPNIETTSWFFANIGIYQSIRHVSGFLPSKSGGFGVTLCWPGGPGGLSHLTGPAFLKFNSWQTGVKGIPSILRMFVFFVFAFFSYKRLHEILIWLLFDTYKPKLKHNLISGELTNLAAA